MKAKKVCVVPGVVVVSFMLGFIGVVTVDCLLRESTPAHAAEDKCAKCGNANAQCQSGCKHTADGCPCKTFTADKGPDKIDQKVLASYSKSMQDAYTKVFSKRCSKCHTLARPLNTDFAPTKWEEYIKKMMRKPGSGVKSDDAKRIWQFLVYDTVKRKEKFYEKLPNSEKEVAKKVIAEAGK